MAVRGRDAGARAPLRWRAAGPLLAALLTASACAVPADRDDTLTTGALDATLERRAAAVLAHDRVAISTRWPPRPPSCGPPSAPNSTGSPTCR